MMSDPVSIFSQKSHFENCIDIEQDGDGAIMLGIHADGQENTAVFENEKAFLNWVMDALYEELFTEKGV